MTISREQKADLARHVQHHMREEFDLELGDLAAGLLIDYFADLLGPLSYNEAIADARAIVLDRADTMQAELEALTKPIQAPR